MESEKNMERVGKADDKAKPNMSLCTKKCLTIEMLMLLPGVANLKPSFLLSCPTEEHISIKEDVSGSSFEESPLFNLQ